MVYSPTLSIVLDKTDMKSETKVRNQETDRKYSTVTE